jgi:hypothetical protein
MQIPVAQRNNRLLIADSAFALLCLLQIGDGGEPNGDGRIFRMLELFFTR